MILIPILQAHYLVHKFQLFIKCFASYINVRDITNRSQLMF